MGNLEDKFKEILEVKALEDRFKFIENETLRTNLTISLQYILFLIILEEESKLQGSVSYSIFKNIILNAAAIVEGTLHHLLESLIKKGKLDGGKAMGTEVTYSDKKVLYITTDKTEICGIHVKRKPLKLKTNTNFIEVNRACKRVKIVDNELFVEIEEL